MENLKTTKKRLLEEFESCLFDFWGEEPTRRKISEAWRDYLDCIKETEAVPKKWYTLAKDERENLYRIAGV